MKHRFEFVTPIDRDWTRDEYKAVMRYLREARNEVEKAIDWNEVNRMAAQAQYGSFEKIVTITCRNFKYSQQPPDFEIRFNS